MLGHRVKKCEIFQKLFQPKKVSFENKNYQLELKNLKSTVPKVLIKKREACFNY